MVKYILLFFTLFIFLIGACAQEPEFKPLFNGTDFTGWQEPDDNVWWTIEEGVLIGKSDPELRGSVLWTSKVYDDFILQLAMGYDTVLAESGSSLSGGQKQRIAIARALMGSPSIIIFDEATSALDDETQRLVLNNMKKIAAQRTVITIAHRLSSVKHCDRILFLEKGRITEQGAHHFLLAANGRYARLWKLQSEVREETNETY